MNSFLKFRMWFFFFLYVCISHSYWNRISTSFFHPLRNVNFPCVCRHFLIDSEKIVWERDFFFHWMRTRWHTVTHLQWCACTLTYGCGAVCLYACASVWTMYSTTNTSWMWMSVYDTVVQLANQYYTLSQQAQIQTNAHKGIWQAHVCICNDEDDSNGCPNNNNNTIHQLNEEKKKKFERSYLLSIWKRMKLHKNLMNPLKSNRNRMQRTVFVRRQIYFQHVPKNQLKPIKWYWNIPNNSSSHDFTQFESLHAHTNKLNGVFDGCKFSLSLWLFIARFRRKKKNTLAMTCKRYKCWFTIYLEGRETGRSKRHECIKGEKAKEKHHDKNTHTH